MRWRKSGSIYVLDMGEPVKIMDLARQLIRFYGYEPGVNMEDQLMSTVAPAKSCIEEKLMMERAGS